MLFAPRRSFYELVLIQKLIYGLSAVWFVQHFVHNGSETSSSSFQTFELITGHWLFKPESGDGWQCEDDHLAKMMELTGEKFSTALLERSRLRNHYFDHTGDHIHAFVVGAVLMNCVQETC